MAGLMAPDCFATRQGLDGQAPKRFGRWREELGETMATPGRSGFVNAGKQEKARWRCTTATQKEATPASRLPDGRKAASPRDARQHGPEGDIGYVG